MSHIVPSQARTLIEGLFPKLGNEKAESAHRVGVTAGPLFAILELLDRIPDRLIRLSAQDFANYCASKAALRDAVENRSPNQVNCVVHSLPNATHTPHFELCRLLAMCPDEAPDSSTTGLEFIPDVLLRETLRGDIASANSALVNHEYKAATVLAGSVIEALLLWSLEKHGEANVKATYTASPAAPLNEWSLGQMIPAAHSCRLIADDTNKQAELAQKFRNLIHPGRQSRLQDKCDRGTALGALAGIERVAIDLAKRFQPPP